ncbi:putative addiction module antidote protein [bacterium]|nr:putative addiction module antidote protein [bacterium]
MPKLTFKEDLVERLKKPKAAQAYLDAAVADGDPALFLEALKNVAEAHGGMSLVARKVRLDRAGLYRMFSANGNPTYKNLRHVLEALGYRFKIEKIGA